MPAFPTGRALPQLPSVGPPRREELRVRRRPRPRQLVHRLDRSGRRDRGTASTYVRPLLEALTGHGILDVVSEDGGALRSFALAAGSASKPPSSPGAGRRRPHPTLACTTAATHVTGTSGRADPTRRRSLPPPPLHRASAPPRISATYYRTLYHGDMRRVVARDTPRSHHRGPPQPTRPPSRTASTTPGSPNVLVATPTLEMGIDIGDLSTVLLASVPRTVASYLQRVGRAGRQTGNALNVTFVGRPRPHRRRLLRPAGHAQRAPSSAPGAYLSAEEILRRQFLASVMDTLAGDDRITPPGPPRPVLAPSGPGSFLGAGHRPRCAGAAPTGSTTSSPDSRPGPRLGRTTDDARTERCANGRRRQGRRQQWTRDRRPRA